MALGIVEKLPGIGIHQHVDEPDEVRLPEYSVLFKPLQVEALLSKLGAPSDTPMTVRFVASRIQWEGGRPDLTDSSQSWVCFQKDFLKTNYADQAIPLTRPSYSAGFNIGRRLRWGEEAQDVSHDALSLIGLKKKLCMSRAV